MNPEIYQALVSETLRQANTIELIASENFTSAAVRQLCGSVFTNEYAEGLPQRRYYNGCEHADTVEQLAIKYATKLFGCSYANVQPHSGANANLAVYKALLLPDDTTLGMDLSAGGHLSHGSLVNISGAWFNSQHYGVNKHGHIDYDQVQLLAEQHKPRLIIAGASAYSGIINWQRFAEIARSVGALLLCDVSHYSGLIAGGVYPSAFPHADVVTSTTHKTLRGPRGGVVLWNNPELGRQMNSAVFPGTQGGPLVHVIAAKAQCFSEALQPEFSEYAQRVVDNARAMCDEFQQLGVKVVSGGTSSHMFTLDLTGEALSGQQYADMLEQQGITVNKNSVPGDLRSFVETSGVRIGTAAETTRGYTAQDFRRLAQQMTVILRKKS